MRSNEGPRTGGDMTISQSETTAVRPYPGGNTAKVTFSLRGAALEIGIVSQFITNCVLCSSIRHSKRRDKVDYDVRLRQFSVVLISVNGIKIFCRTHQC